PIARTMLQDETGGLMTYLTRLFARKAVRTENAKIFKEMKDGNSAKKVATVEDIKKEYHKLDPAISQDAKVVTNQTGFARLDLLVDENGRGLLQPNPEDATKHKLMGMDVEVFSDAELPNVSNRGVAFIGDMQTAVAYFDRNVYEFSVSEEAGFTRNTVITRTIQRFDTKVTDKDAYVHLEIDGAGEETP